MKETIVVVIVLKTGKIRLKYMPLINAKQEIKSDQGGLVVSHRKMDAPPDVVLLPFPAQGHIKPMWMLAEVLSGAGINTTFVNTDHNQSLMSSATCFHPNLKLRSIPDGLPEEHPRSGPWIKDLFGSIEKVFKPAFRDLMVSLRPSCVIADGIMSFAVDVALELGIRVVAFRTYSATCTWLYFHLQKLVDEGELPVLLQGSSEEEVDRVVNCIPGFENVLRRRDLPSICRRELDDPILSFFIQQAAKMKRASALILNTFQELESPFISHLHSIYSKVYTIGPLHKLLHNTRISFNSDSTTVDHHSQAALETKVCGVNNSAAKGSLRQEDRTCMEWLESQPPKSVIYVSFGSLVTLTPHQVLEFWNGLVNSGVSFLWTIRPDLVLEENGATGSNLEEIIRRGRNEKRRIVSWAPQEEVLSHPAVAGFLTHSGWNSTLESISAGKPMICWPDKVDQLVNSRCVSELWKVGLDMKDMCDTLMVEKMVRDVMGSCEKGEDLARAAERLARSASNSVCEGGSSDSNIKELIQDLRSIHSAKVI